MSGDSEKWIAYTQGAQKVNRAPHAKDTGTWTGGHDARAQTAGTGIVEVGDFYYLSTASAHGSRPAALRAREGRHGGTRERGRECKKAKYNEGMQYFVTCIHIHMTKILMRNHGKAGRAEEQTQRAIRLFRPACIDGWRTPVLSATG